MTLNKGIDSGTKTKEFSVAALNDETRKRLDAARAEIDKYHFYEPPR